MFYRVISRTPDKLNKALLNLRLDRNDNVRQKQLRRFAPVSKGDNVLFSNGNAWVRLRKMARMVKIQPAWSTQKFLNINGEQIPLTIKEIESEEELEGYKALTHFHYRGNDGVGRRIPLIAKIGAWNLPEVGGFLELSSSLLVNVARKKVLNAPFQDSDLDIGWDNWDMETAKKYNNALVRISRCVVYPELRGLGLAVELTNAAIEFARERWHIGGLRPCFIEIVAEMLRYWPFVEKNGFIKVGETEGNNKRDPKAMAYLLKRRKEGNGYPKGGGGIMSMHRKHAEKIAGIIENKNGFTEDKIVKLLSTRPDEMSRKNWLQLYDFYRRKKPTYMYGLTTSAHKHLISRVPEKLPTPTSPTNIRSGVLVSVRNMRITARVQPGDSKRCRNIQEAFGIVSVGLELELLRDFSAEFRAGEITLITGPSGSGKSLFLDTFHHMIGNTNRKKTPKDINMTGRKIVAKNLRIAQLRPPPRDKTPIDILGKHHLDEAMRILAQAGLAEPHLFVRPARSLSVGQSYRLALALALAKNPDLILIDEFCEPLDDYTAAAVCRKIRHAAKMKGVCIVAATANARRLLVELSPHRTLLLASNNTYKWIDKFGYHLSSTATPATK